eukprot:gnl/TRDRNA2_/TRDRNA2_81485_c0_seq1.p1 gnl/TRDRNA2_/TRDRNA2_81485_c0~~gnl/TRDRNA2_/TRDRNA2_81485_c0_seq1.p1  ORF type:complete len:314 (+),score=59.99 gnl/TRDRNA2_/TRDRNA2_81485_c0_seq1:103-942(+)
MSADTFRKVRAVLLLAMLLGAEAQKFRQDTKMASPSFQEQGRLIERRLEVSKMDSRSPDLDATALGKAAHIAMARSKPLGMHQRHVRSKAAFTTLPRVAPQWHRRFVGTPRSETMRAAAVEESVDADDDVDVEIDELEIRRQIEEDIRRMEAAGIDPEHLRRDDQESIALRQQAQIKSSDDSGSFLGFSSLQEAAPLTALGVVGLAILYKVWDSFQGSSDSASDAKAKTSDEPEPNIFTKLWNFIFPKPKYWEEDDDDDGGGGGGGGGVRQKPPAPTLR